MASLPIVTLHRTGAVHYDRRRRRELQFQIPSINGAQNGGIPITIEEENDPFPARIPTENDSLLDRREAREKRAEQRSRMRTCALVFTLLIVAAVFLGIGIMLKTVNDTLTAAQAQITPKIDVIINATMGAVDDTAAAVENIMGSTADGSMLTSMTVPQLIDMVNSTKRTMNHIEELLQRPTVTLGALQLAGQNP